MANACYISTLNDWWCQTVFMFPFTFIGYKY